MISDDSDPLEKFLLRKMDPEGAKKLSQKYSHLNSDNYGLAYSSSDIAEDILYLEELNDNNRLTLRFANNKKIHLKLFQLGKLTPLRIILPILENLNLIVFDKRSYHITLKSGEEVWISDFILENDNITNVDETTILFKDAISKILSHEIENDRFNGLILQAGLGWRQITILRAYCKYWQQLGMQYSKAYIEQILLKNAATSKTLISFFELRFSLSHHYEKDLEIIEKKIISDLDKITNIDEDKVLRTYLNLIQATVRTNYFKTPTPVYLTLKFESGKIKDIALPKPEYETFIYSSKFEGIHLRSSKIARGGIRWSERFEDFRTEVLGLMKTQTVKNSLIVPTGAKGGFILKLDSEFNKEHIQNEAVTRYKQYVSGLLEITDNMINNKIIPPKEVVCYDNYDPYLVVAADKGTASFSDVANDLSNQYHFWLADAFASGGSSGYNHKSMGITSRGAWESVKRHFYELNMDICTEDFTVIGIGDMSGDVFGNGMLLSTHIKLIAAFDHRCIFIDPDPDAETSYQERLRLFNLPSSSWEDYDTKLLSKGGGIFSRTKKMIPLTKEIKKVLDIRENELSPNELIRAILKARVDLFWNGGIGTFIKASHESQESVADNSNKNIRINANELRCKMVGEGGNLGFTQMARIEYASKGGMINTDFIDNVGGVDCSDREVNIKIALNKLVHENVMTLKRRNKLLFDMTDEVTSLVLKDAHNQALAISLCALRSVTQIEQYQNFIKYLENKGIINRELEKLPDDEEFVRRKANGQGLLHPEIAVILSYTKLLVKKEILNSSITDQPCVQDILINYFPKKMIKNKIIPAIENHQLKKEIIATRLSNDLVDRMGVLLIYNLKEETGYPVRDIILAYIIAHHIYNLDEIIQMIESLENKLPISLQYDIFIRVQDLIRNSTHWILKNLDLNGDIHHIIKSYTKGMDKLEDLIPELIVGDVLHYISHLEKITQQAGVSSNTVKKVASSRALYSGLNIIEVVNRNHFDITHTAKIYFAVGQLLDLVWFRDHLFMGTSGDYWDNLARSVLRHELDVQQRYLTEAVIKSVDDKTLDAHATLKVWSENNNALINRWNSILTNLQAHPNPNFTMFFIAIKELSKLTLSPKK